MALVTGAAQGIGAEIARRFARGGYAVALLDIKREAVAATAEAIEAGGGRAASFEVDIGDAAAVEATVADVAKQLGDLAVVVNNAAIRDLGPALSAAPATFEAILRTNLSGAFHVSTATARRMACRERGGVILAIASVAGVLALPDRVAYVASKHGLIGLTRALAYELGPLNIRVNAIAPGGVDTPLARAALAASAERRAAAATAIPLGRLGTTEDIAEIAWFLASPAAAYINGAVIAADGGFSAGKLL